MVPASFPEIESPSLRKSGVLLESEELRSSAIGRPVVMWGMPRISSMMNSSLIVIGGQKTLHFGSRAGDGAPGSFGKGNGITFLYFAARFSRRKTSGVRCARLALQKRGPKREGEAERRSGDVLVRHVVERLHDSVR